MRYIALSAAIAIGACGRVSFDPLGGGDGGGSTTGDGGSGSGGDGGGGTDSSLACTNTDPSTTFPGGIPCANWGGNAAFNNAGLSESSGTLIITPNASSAGASGRCQRDNVAISASGAFVEVSQVLAGTSSTTRLEAVWGGQVYFIGTENNGMRAGNVTQGVTFTGGAVQRWWRIRPTNGEVHFEYSPDGMAWTDFALIGGIPTGMASLRVVATTPNAEAAAGAARFESVNVCP